MLPPQCCGVERDQASVWCGVEASVADRDQQVEFGAVSLRGPAWFYVLRADGSGACGWTADGLLGQGVDVGGTLVGKVCGVCGWWGVGRACMLLGAGMMCMGKLREGCNQSLLPEEWPCSIVWIWIQQGSNSRFGLHVRTHAFVAGALLLA